MFDIIVVGGGHAGAEAVLAAARKNYKVGLVTLNYKSVAMLACNPSLGGPAKGVVIREIDALGGEMAKAADATYLQMKMLNTAKGPGVQSLRVQADKIAYQTYIQDKIKEFKNIEIIEDMVVGLIFEDNVCNGVVLEDGTKLYAKKTILTTGTSLESKILIGHTSISEGPDGEKAAHGLSKELEKQGVPIQRLKTGTPARIKADTIDYTKMQLQTGTKGELAFSYETKKFIPFEEQIPCYLLHTTPQTHKIINANLNKSAMYGGLVEGIGPRYCPSIEDKLVKFADKESHQIFVEPESLSLETMYLQGFSTSMPKDVQEKMIYSLPGFENSKILKYAYAIEYDAIDPTYLNPTLQLRGFENLFCAGQINGTSGYEEAAAQGLMASLNAMLELEGKEPFILRRDEAYIGVMIDDLTTKGAKEPYRLLTSRAEFRLLLRHDNADLRLRHYGYKMGLVPQEIYNVFLEKEKDIEELKTLLEKTYVSQNHPLNDVLYMKGLPLIQNSASIAQLLKRPNHDFSLISPHIELNKHYSEEVIKQVEIQIKYEGYIKKQEQQASLMKELEDIILPKDIIYSKIPNLAIEARQKLDEVKPLNIGQASRISGVNPSDINILIMYLKIKKDESNV